MRDRRPTGGDRSTGHAVPDGGRYEIRIGGDLHPRWAAWFDGLAVHPGRDGTTVLVGPVADQAALHGLLERVRDLGVPLISVIRLQDA